VVELIGPDNLCEDLREAARLLATTTPQ
jgi:hypothetical protein